VSFANNTRAFFGNDEYIAVPPNSGLWSDLSSCLWRAPAFIDEWHILASYDEYKDNPSIKHLFNIILEVPDIECEHYIDQLIAWKACGDEVDNIEEVYGELTQSVPEGHAIQNLRLDCRFSLVRALLTSLLLTVSPLSRMG